MANNPMNWADDYRSLLPVVSANPSCLHCGDVIPANDVCVCSCKLTPGVHTICRKCLTNRKLITVEWVSPLNRARIERMNTVRGPELLRHAARGNA